MSEAYEIAESIWKKQANGTMPMAAVSIDDAWPIVREFMGKDESMQVIDNVAEALSFISQERAFFHLCPCGSYHNTSALYTLSGAFIGHACDQCRQTVIDNHLIQSLKGEF